MKDWINEIEQDYGLDSGSTDEDSIRFHLRYIAYYFTNEEYDKRVKAVLIEKKHLSMTFLTDYKNFYSNVINQYERICSRIHFFSCSLTNEKMTAILHRGNAKDIRHLSDSYLGCMVIRPLHKHIVGTTLLRPYPKPNKEANSTRFFPAVRPYNVDLFGLPITLDTLAFTNQDKTVGACASFALWMAFHKTHKLFKTKLLTPSEITRHAGRSARNRHRQFPNRGLDSYQVSQVIESLGLENQYREFLPDKSEKIHYKLWTYKETKNNQNTQTVLTGLRPDTPKGESEKEGLREVFDVDLIKAHIYAYSQLEVPVLLGLDFEKGEHLVVISGYSLLNQPESQRADFEAMMGERLLLKSRRIDRFYCHDDNIGAFSRLFFSESMSDLDSGYYGQVITSWPSKATQPGKFSVRESKSDRMVERARLKDISIPIEEGIRIDFEDIYRQSGYVDNLFQELNKTISGGDNPRINQLRSFGKQEWDIYLTTARKYKADILQSKERIHQVHKLDLLAQILPRYIWVVRGRIFQESEQLITELVFDSTESPSAYSCKVVIFDESVFEVLALLSGEMNKNTAPEDKGNLQVAWKRIFYDKHLKKIVSLSAFEEKFVGPLRSTIKKLGKLTRKIKVAK